MQRLPAGHHDLETGTGGEQGRHLCGGADHLLEVVEHQQELLLAQIGLELFERRMADDFLDLERLSDGRDNE